VIALAALTDAGRIFAAAMPLHAATHPAVQAVHAVQAAATPAPAGAGASVTGTAGACSPTSLPGAASCGLGGPSPLVTAPGLSAFASGMQSAASDMLKGSVSWWLNVPSVDVASEPTVAFVRDVLAFVAASVAVVGVMWAGIRMMASHKAEPGLDVLTSLLRLVAVLGIGVALTAILLQVGDSFSTWVLGLSGAAAGVSGKLATVAAMSSVSNPVMVLFLSLALFLVGGAQGLFMLLRQGAIIILVGALPLAAAGSFMPSTRTWFPRVAGWLLALIFYKPVAALIYAVGFGFIAGDGSLRDVIMALVMLVLAVIAFPKLMQLFSWAIPIGLQAANRAGGSLAAISGSGTAAVALQGVGGGVSALQHAALIQSDLGPSAAPSSSLSTNGAPGPNGRLGGLDMPGGAAAAAGSSSAVSTSFAAKGRSGSDPGAGARNSQTTSNGAASPTSQDDASEPGTDNGTGDASWA
jgi:hypothetical protein